MAFHLGFELPLRTSRSGGPETARLNPDIPQLTFVETQIVKIQIRKNSEIINSYLKRIDLFVNQEKYPQRESFIEKIRERMLLLMEENDTFRLLLWRHLQGEVVKAPVPVAE